MSATTEPLGWYHIDEMYNLYIDGTLTKRHVEHICVDEDPNGECLVKHFDRAGNLISSNKLTWEDIDPVLKSKDNVNRPWHI